MKLELRGITKRFGALVANDAHRPDGRAGRDPRPARRERRRQVDADERALRPLPGRRGRDPPRRQAVQHFAGPGDAIARRHRHGAPALHAGPGLHGRRERHARRRADRRRAARLDLEAARAAGRARSPSASASTSTRTRSIEDLPVGVQQRVEIIKALSRDAKVLIFDEPTAVLTPAGDRRASWRSCASSSEAGTSIVFITHKLREVREVADRITVIRRGKVVGEADADRDEGRARRDDGRARRSSLTVRQGAAKPGEAPCVVEGLTVIDDARPVARRRRRASRCAPARSSAIAGVQGNGQTELVEALIGLQQPRRPARSRSTATSSSGARPGRSSTPASATSRRTGRPTGWSASSRSPRTSCSTARHGSPFVTRQARSSSEPARDVREARRSRSSTSARRASTAPAGQLSGGNQQKVVVARELSRDTQAARRRAADPRHRRRLDRVRPQAHRRGARRRRPRPRRLDRARRGGRARRPDRGDVPRPHRRHRPGDTPRDVLGLMMAGERPEGARGSTLSVTEQHPPPRSLERRRASDRSRAGRCARSSAEA